MDGAQQLSAEDGISRPELLWGVLPLVGDVPTKAASTARVKRFLTIAEQMADTLEGFVKAYRPLEARMVRGNEKAATAMKRLRDEYDAIGVCLAYFETARFDQMVKRVRPHRRKLADRLVNARLIATQPLRERRSALAFLLDIDDPTIERALASALDAESTAKPGESLAFPT